VEFVTLKGNTFNLGDEFQDGHFDEKPLLSVKVDNFEMSKFEITNTQFSSFLKAYGSQKVKRGEYEDEIIIYENDKGLKYIQGTWSPSVGYEYFPVVGVTWYGAMEFCKYFHYRLPTEAEWEYAAKELGKKIKYGNGSDIANPREINFNTAESKDSTLNNSLNTISGTQQSVGAYPPNILGIFQMSGNVWEWCLDWYEFTHNPEKTVNPTGPWLGKYKVIRGGSFNNSAKAVRNTERSFLAPHRYAKDVGFRVVRTFPVQMVQEEVK
jgi:formylglycine-generating enzyme required for sulfatase activity